MKLEIAEIKAGIPKEQILEITGIDLETIKKTWDFHHTFTAQVSVCAVNICSFLISI